MKTSKLQAIALALTESLSRPSAHNGAAFCVHPGETEAERDARHNPAGPPGSTYRSMSAGDWTQQPTIEASAFTFDPDRYCPACGKRGKWVLRAERLELHNTPGLRFLESLRPALPEPVQIDLF